MSGLTRLATILGDHDEMIRMGTNAAAHAATFSWDNTAAATLQAYRKAVLAAVSPATSSLRPGETAGALFASPRPQQSAVSRVSSGCLSALTPKMTSTTPPMIISAAPMK